MKTKTAIVLTEHVELRTGGSGRSFAKKSTVVPVSRIAKVNDCSDWFANQSTRHVSPPASQILLRTPEESLFVGETPERVAALMNGEG